jgi:hypothetical protein
MSENIRVRVYSTEGVLIELFLSNTQNTSTFICPIPLECVFSGVELKRVEPNKEIQDMHYTELTAENTALRVALNCAKKELGPLPTRFEETGNYYYHNDSVKISAALEIINSALKSDDKL